MGWDFSTELNHLNNEINRALTLVGATEAKVATEPQKLFDAKAEDRIHDDFIEVWFIANIHDAEEQYIGVILFDFDHDVGAKAEMLSDAGSVIYDEVSDREYSVSSNLVQRWGHKIMDTSVQPYYYACPLEYFDKVPARSKYERDWRDQVRGKATK